MLGEKKAEPLSKDSSCKFACSLMWLAFIGIVLVLVRKKPKQTLPKKYGMSNIHEVYVTAE